MIAKLSFTLLVGVALFGGSFTLSDSRESRTPSQVDYRDLRGKVAFPEAVSDLTTVTDSGGLIASNTSREVQSPEDSLKSPGTTDRVTLLVHGTAGWSEECSALLYRQPVDTGKLSDAVQGALGSQPLVTFDKTAPKGPFRIVPLSLAKKSRFAEVEARYNSIRNRTDD